MHRRAGVVLLLSSVGVAIGSSAARAQLHTVRFLDPTAAPTGHDPDSGGLLVETSHNFQEDGVHVEAIWVPSTYSGFQQGHFHHLENGFETSHGFGELNADGWHDLQGFYLRMVDGRPFSLRSIDFRLRVDLLTTDVLVTTDLDPTRNFTGQFVHHTVERFSTFKTLEFSGFDQLDQVFISSILGDPNREQIQFDNIVVWTEPPVFGACCPAGEVGCVLLTAEECAGSGGEYVGDNSSCTDGTFCPVRVGACCTADGGSCILKRPDDCAVPMGVFAGLGVGCGEPATCPLIPGACCVENGAACQEVLEATCTGPDTAFRGEGTQCVDGEPCPVPCDVDADCDDLDACNGTETCDVATGDCVPGQRLDCDDGDACTVDGCDAGSGCTHTGVECDDGQPCTVDRCDPLRGCLHVSRECDDGDACNGIEGCDAQTGECKRGDPLNCDDADACTADGCDPASGCTFTLLECDDGDECTVDACDPGEGCVHSPRGCDDGDPCTVDSCDAATGCASTPIECDDGDACNGLESCDPETGLCQAGSAVDCDDENACTIDGCLPVGGCTHVEVSCDDSDACTTDSCDPVSGCRFDAVICDDGDACNGMESCDPATGACVAGAEIECDDGDACTVDGCNPASGCTFAPLECDDADPCTLNACDSELGCTFTPVRCDDENACNGVETCDPESGVCVDGHDLNCDDADPCTLDECDPQSGCYHAPVACDDGDPCTVDSCDPASGCVHAPVTCDDGDVCNGMETCNAGSGACEAGTPLVCEDDDACTVNGCDPLSGCAVEPLDCDDNDVCTIDSCDTDSGCGHVPLCDEGFFCDQGECSCFSPLGDRDGDGDRDRSDLVHLALCLRGPAQARTPPCECQDLNGDGFVDLFDVANFLATSPDP